MPKLVRLKPYNPQRGFKARSYTVHGVRIDEAKGWHEVEDSIADYLETVTVDPNNPESPYAFDVKSKEEAIRMAEREKIAAQVRAEPQNAIRITSTQSTRRGVVPVSSADRAAAAQTHYGRPYEANRSRTNVARPDESEASRDHALLTDEQQANVPGAPSRRSRRPASAGTSGEEYKLEVTDLSKQVDAGGHYAGNQQPFNDGSLLEADDRGVSAASPDPRNLGKRKEGAFDDTPFVDGSPDALAPGDLTADPRNPDPRNVGRRSAGAYDDTPFVDGSRDAVVAPASIPMDEEDRHQMDLVPADGGGVENLVPARSASAAPGAQTSPRTRSRAPSK